MRGLNNQGIMANKALLTVPALFGTSIAGSAAILAG
jgi:hypothetical protein